MKEVASELDGILVVAHELKEPLAVLRQLSLGLPEMGVGGERMRAQMVEVSERAMRQVNDLAKIRRLEEGLFEMEPVVVREVCDEVMGELAGLCGGRRLAVKYSNKARLVTANRELLSSVIYHFGLSALHYAGVGAEPGAGAGVGAEPEAGVEVGAGTGSGAGAEPGAESRVAAELCVRDHQGRVQVQVRDFGPALPVRVWRELQGGSLARPTSVAMRPGSSGLGLYIASRFSRYMGAPVRAVRHRDGTSFCVELMASRQVGLWKF